MLGAEPYICANVGSGTPEEARSWLEYCNAGQDTALTRERAVNGSADPFGVRYWGVGNENWGCGGSMTPEHYADHYRRFATYLRRAGGSVTLIACGSEPGFQAWDERFLDGLRGRESLVDALAIHHYSGWGIPAVGYSDADYYRLLTAVGSMDDHIAQAARLCRDRSSEDHQIKLIVDEWGTWYREATTARGLLQDSTMLDAVFAGMSFHMFHRHAADLVMTNMAQTVNVLQALLLTEGPKLCLTPTYWVYDLFKAHREGRVAPANVRGPSLTLDDGEVLALCSASATVRENDLTLSLVNADLDVPCTITASPSGTSVSGVKSARLLTSGSVRNHNTPDDPELVAPADLEVTVSGGSVETTLPPFSVAVAELALER
jgi:alpha-N-arabinofuranosidase